MNVINRIPHGMHNSPLEALCAQIECARVSLVESGSVMVAGSRKHPET